MTTLPNSYTHHSSKNFTMIQNELIRSPELSSKAFKLLCIGLSHSGDWTFRKSQIATCFKEGDHTLNEAMKELRALGYLHTVPRQDGTKFNGHHWFWFDHPVNDEEFKLFYRRVGFPGDQEIRDSEDPCDIRKQRVKNTNLDKNNNMPPAAPAGGVVVSSSSPSEDPHIFSCLQDLEMDDTLKAKLTKAHVDEEDRLSEQIELMQQSSTIVRNPFGWLSNAMKGPGYTKSPSVEDIATQAKEWALKSIGRYDNQFKAMYTVSLSADYVEFAPAGNAEPLYFRYDSKSFKEDVIKQLKRMKEYDPSIDVPDA